MLAAKVVQELKTLDSGAQFFGSGGKYMEQEGVNLCLHIRQMAFMGLIEVLLNLFKIRKNFKIIKQTILDVQPDVIVLVDYPGFNLRMAGWAKAKGFKVVYYVAPKVWAWKESRVKKIRTNVNLLLVILPFEKEYFEQFGINTVYVGHPLLEITPEYSDTVEKNKVAILPGSRKQEVRRMLPVMLDAMHIEGVKSELVVAGLSELGEEYYEKIIRGRAELVLDRTYEVLSKSKLAVVASGTASLETALLRVPQVVCYAVHPITYWVAKFLIKINYISLVNLILKAPAVPEMIQNDFTPLSLKNVTMSVMQDNLSIQNDYLRLRKLLGHYKASKEVARQIVLCVKV